MALGGMAIMANYQMIQLHPIVNHQHPKIYVMIIPKYTTNERCLQSLDPYSYLQVYEYDPAPSQQSPCQWCNAWLVLEQPKQQKTHHQEMVLNKLWL